jgi:hypothetical protein
VLFSWFAPSADQRGAGGPGADDDPLFDPEGPVDGGLPGADDDRFLEPRNPLRAGFPGARDEPFFGAGLCAAAGLLAPPAPISATVASTASDRDVLLVGV